MRDNEAYYFLTETIVGWIDLFTRKEYSLLIIDSLKYCQQHKNLFAPQARESFRHAPEKARANGLKK